MLLFAIKMCSNCNVAYLNVKCFGSWLLSEVRVMAKSSAGFGLGRHGHLLSLNVKCVNCFFADVNMTWMKNLIAEDVMAEVCVLLAEGKWIILVYFIAKLPCAWLGCVRRVSILYGRLFLWLGMRGGWSSCAKIEQPYYRWPKARSCGI